MYIDLKSMFTNKFKLKTFILFLIPTLLYLFFPVITGINFTSQIRTFESTNQLFETLKNMSWVSFVQPSVPEEMVFRAWYLNVLMGLLKGKQKTIHALIISNILFSTIHLPYYIFANHYNFITCFISFLDIFIVGCLFGFILLKTKNILVPIFFHWLWDTVAFTFFI